MRFEFSAGGVVYKHEIPLNEGARNTTKNIVVLVAQHSQHHGWVFPKGLIDQKPKTEDKRRETKEEAALREVKEETGVYAKIVKPLTPVTYWYAFGGDPSTRFAARRASSGQEKVKKTVYYFLMEYVSGDIKDHDFEMENVEWLPIDEVEKRLTYKSDKEVWAEAKDKIRNSNIEIRNKSK